MTRCAAMFQRVHESTNGNEDHSTAMSVVCAHGNKTEGQRCVDWLKIS